MCGHASSSSCLSLLKSACKQSKAGLCTHISLTRPCYCPAPFLPHRYLITMRPFASLFTLLAEILISCIELIVLIFGTVHQQGHDLPSDPVLVAIIVLLVGVSADCSCFP